MNITITVGLLLLYFGLMVWAAFFSRTGHMTENTIEEYAVGGRNFSWIIVLFTMLGLFVTASVYSSWFSWAANDGIFVQYLMVYSVFGFVFTYLFAKRIWVWGKNYSLLTQADYFQLRYKNKYLTKLLASCSILIEAPWIIIEFAALGHLMEAITFGAIPHKLGTIIIVGFVITYIVYSGMKAIAITEIFQGVLSTVIVLFGLIAMIYELYGGFGPLYQQLMEIAPDNLTITKGGIYTHEYWSSVIITASFGIMAWASFFTRIYTSKDVLSIKKVSCWSAGIAFVCCGLMLVLALGGILYPEVLEKPDIAFFLLADKAFGPVFLGLAAVVVVAAGMSLISVVMNSHSIIISENFIKPFNPNMTSAGRVKAARWSTLIYSLIALGISLLDLPNLYSIAIVAYEGIVQFIPLIILSLYWKRSNKWGAFLGFTIAIIVTLYTSAQHLTFGGFSGGMLGLLINIIIHISCGYIFPQEDHVDELFAEIDNYEDEVFCRS